MKNDAPILATAITKVVLDEIQIVANHIPDAKLIVGLAVEMTESELHCNGKVLVQRQASRIFVVDDHPLLSSNLAQMLRAAGFAAKPFTNSYEMLATAAVYPPELLISEIMMPLISGLQLAECVKLRYPNCKVILMSAQVTTTDFVRSPNRNYR